MESSLQRYNSKASQCVESWFGRNFFYIWEYQQHIGATSQKIEFILHSSIDWELEMTVLGNISHGNTCEITLL